MGGSKCIFPWIIISVLAKAMTGSASPSPTIMFARRGRLLYEKRDGRGFEVRGFQNFEPRTSDRAAILLARIIHDGSSRNRIETRQGAMGTRREEKHSFWPPLASGPAPLVQTLAMATEAFMNHAGTSLQKMSRAFDHSCRSTCTKVHSTNG